MRMSALGTAIERRLGLAAIFVENVETWTARTGREGARDRVAAGFWFYGLPLIPAVALVHWHLQLQSIGQILSGVAVFTGLLFGLLVLMFNTGVTLRKDSSAITNAHDLRGLVGDLRANTTYAAIVALLLAMLLVVAAIAVDDKGRAPWPFAPPVAYLFLHLGLVLMVILRRLRTAFNYITR
jgi:hypothetical protein